jgi:hypothetical protein
MKPASVTVDPEQQRRSSRPTGREHQPERRHLRRARGGRRFVLHPAQPGAAALSEVMRNNPELTPAIAPLWAQNLDIPHADKLAQVLAAMAPRAVQAILNPDTAKQPKPRAADAAERAAEAGLQEAINHAHDAQAEADEAQDKLRDKEKAEEVAMYNAETARLKVTGANAEQIQAIVQQMLNDMLSNRAPTLPGDPDGGYPDPRRSSREQPPPGPQIPDPAASSNPRTRRVRVFLCLSNLKEPELGPRSHRIANRRKRRGRRASKTRCCRRHRTTGRAAGGPGSLQARRRERRAERARQEGKDPEQREIDRLRRRVDNLTRQKYDAAAQLPKRQAQPAATDTQGSDDEPVTLSRAEIDRMVAERAEKLAPAVTEQRAVIEHRQGVVKLAKEWGQEEFDAKASELDDVFGGLKDAQGRPKPATDAIFEADDPKAVIEYLTDPDNADEAERIARLPALRRRARNRPLEPSWKPKKEGQAAPQQCRQAARSGQGRRCALGHAGPEQHQGVHRLGQRPGSRPLATTRSHRTKRPRGAFFMPAHF